MAQVLAKRLKGRIFGFVVEEPTAGGHNAPPRGHPLPNASGEPVYGERDNVDYSVMKDLGLPFWIGGSTASPERLVWALSVRATGIQVGTAFALCEESGMHHLWKNWIRELSFTGKLVIHTSSRVSPTGFPFKVAGVQGTLFDSGIYEQRERACQHGALVTLYRKPDGSIGYRCPSEPVESFVAKGGKAEDTVGRRCLCTGLLAGVGLADDQAAIITLGDDVNRLMQELMDHPKDTYNVDDVFRYLGL